MDPKSRYSPRWNYSSFPSQNDDYHMVMMKMIKITMKKLVLLAVVVEDQCQCVRVRENGMQEVASPS